MWLPQLPSSAHARGSTALYAADGWTSAELVDAAARRGRRRRGTAPCRAHRARHVRRARCTTPDCASPCTTERWRTHRLAHRRRCRRRADHAGRRARLADRPARRARCDPGSSRSSTSRALLPVAADRSPSSAHAVRYDGRRKEILRADGGRGAVARPATSRSCTAPLVEVVAARRLPEAGDGTGRRAGPAWRRGALDGRSASRLTGVDLARLLVVADRRPSTQRCRRSTAGAPCWPTWRPRPGPTGRARSPRSTPSSSTSCASPCAAAARSSATARASSPHDVLAAGRRRRSPRSARPPARPATSTSSCSPGPSTPARLGPLRRRPRTGARPARRAPPARPTPLLDAALTDPATIAPRSTRGAPGWPTRRTAPVRRSARSRRRCADARTRRRRRQARSARRTSGSSTTAGRSRRTRRPRRCTTCASRPRSCATCWSASPRCCPSAERKQFVSALKVLQDNLGEHQDAAVHVEELRAVGDRGAPPRRAGRDDVRPRRAERPDRRPTCRGPRRVRRALRRVRHRGRPATRCGRCWPDLDGRREDAGDLQHQGRRGQDHRRGQPGPRGRRAGRPGAAVGHRPAGRGHVLLPHPPGRQGRRRRS